MFSFISMNWRGRPLVSYRTIVELISNTTTSKGLKIRAEEDLNDYQTGTKVSAAELAASAANAAQVPRRLELHDGAISQSVSLRPNSARMGLRGHIDRPLEVVRTGRRTLYRDRGVSEHR